MIHETFGFEYIWKHIQCIGKPEVCRSTHQQKWNLLGRDIKPFTIRKYGPCADLLDDWNRFQTMDEYGEDDIIES